MIEWTKAKGFSPEVILDRLDRSRIFEDSGRVRYEDYYFLETRPVLESMLRFPAGLDGYERDSLISNAISGAPGRLTKESFLQKINELYSASVSTVERTYFVLGSISIDRSVLLLPQILDGVTLKSVRNYPEKFKSREEFSRQIHRISNPTPRLYTKLLLSAKEKTAIRAATKCIDAIDLLRAVYCLLLNSAMEYGGNEWKPINKVRLGELQSVHGEDGQIATQVYWFEANFMETDGPIVLERDLQTVRRGVRGILKKLDGSQYSRVLKDVLIAYVRALDEQDQHTALIKSWAALEKLCGATPIESSYDIVVRRACFPHEDHEYHKQMLEHLREHRNRTVHSGDTSSKARGDCFQIQFYIYSLMLFHLENSKFFSSFEEANMFLDFPKESATLRRRMTLVRKAVRYHGL